MPPKKGKGKRGGDSDDDPLADQLKYLELKEKEGENVAESENINSKKGNNKPDDSKKGKKDKKKKDESDDDDAPSMLKIASKKDNKKKGDSDDEGTKPAKKDNKKKKKGESDDENDAPSMLKVASKKVTKKGKHAESDEEEEEAPSILKVASKKDKKKGKHAESDEEEEEAPVMLKVASKKDKKKGKHAESDEEEEEAPAMLEAPSKKDKKKGKQNDVPQKGKQPVKVPSSDEEESNEEEEDEEPAKPAIEVEQPKAVPESIKVAAPPAVVEKPSSKSKPHHQEPAAPAPAPAPAASKKTAATPAPTPPAPPAVEAAPAAPEKKKSKLEMKLEQAKVAKEAADKEKAKLAKEAEEKAKREAEAAAAAAAAAKAARQAESEDDEDEDSDEEEAEEVTASSKPIPAAPTSAEEGKLMSTMYGDEVANEYATMEGAGEEKKTSKMKDRLSNKAKRKMAKEEEAKQREAEFNAIAMKKSIEGAQFAVSQTIVDPNDPQWQNALDIIIPNFSISAHNKELFVNSELSIVHGRRYGLVGPNGAGKSTLLKMISARELIVPPRVDFLYVEQEVMADDTPAVDAVLKADKVRWELVQEEKKLLQELEVKADEKKDQRLGEIHEQLDQINASAAESRARRILFGLGFDMEMQVRPTKYFSGGWRMRISLARALFIEPTLLMLDEPTNHLDLNAVIWLDDYLQKWKKTLLVVSHDQDFLNSVCQEIVHLDQKKLVVYRGNYDTFKEQEANKRKQQQKDWEKQEKKLRDLKAKGITKANAEKEQVKAKSREPGARASKNKQTAEVQESAETQVRLIERPKDYEVVFNFPPVPPLSPPILEVRDAHFQYGPNLPWLFHNLSFGIDLQSRICIVGPNGSGKSTVIKLITGEIRPTEGEVYRNQRLKIGVYNQHFVDRLPMEEDPVTYLRRLYNAETYQTVRNKLGKFGLEGHAHTIPIRDLSGGQKARVVFTELSFMAPDILFLDEPTNNLDIESIDALCLALRDYNGGVVMVSHDARLIESTDCQLWVVEDHNVNPWPEGFDKYREHLLEKLEEQLASIVPGSGERPK